MGQKWKNICDAYPHSASCTKENIDLYSTGIKVVCCPSLKEVLVLWGSKLTYSYCCGEDSGNALEEVLDDKQTKKSKKSKK